MTNTNTDTTTVYIDQDPSTLGLAATAADLDGYAANLAEHLATRFNRAIEVEQTLGGRRGGSECPADDEIAEYVRDLHSGDGWIDLVPAEVE